MNFQEIQIPKLGITQGKLFAATPSCSKPSGIDKKDWALSLFNKAVNEVTQGGRRPILAVPSSFLPLRLYELDEYAKSSGLELIGLMDEWDGVHDYGCMTPGGSLRQIIDHLQRGVDVMVLSHTMKVSHFVPAVLYVVSAAHTGDHAKVWCEIAEDVGVGLTQFQRGYLCGLLDATAPEWGIRRMTSAN